MKLPLLFALCASLALVGCGSTKSSVAGTYWSNSIIPPQDDYLVGIGTGRVIANVWKNSAGTCQVAYRAWDEGGSFPFEYFVDCDSAKRAVEQYLNEHREAMVAK